MRRDARLRRCRRRRPSRPARKCLAPRRSFPNLRRMAIQNILWPTAPAAGAFPARFRRPRTLFPQPNAPATSAAAIPAIGPTAPVRPGRVRLPMAVAALARPGRVFLPADFAAFARPTRESAPTKPAAPAQAKKKSASRMEPAAFARPGGEGRTLTIIAAPAQAESNSLTGHASARRGSAPLTSAPARFCAIRKWLRRVRTTAGVAVMFPLMVSLPKSVCTLAPFPPGMSKAGTAIGQVAC